MQVLALAVYSIVSSVFVFVICGWPVAAKTAIEHGPIQSFAIPDGWQQNKENQSFLDPRQHIIIFSGPKTASSLSLRTIRKPGRKLSDEFTALVRQQPRNLKPEEAALINDIASIETINYKFSDGVYRSDKNIQLKDPAIVLLSGKSVIRGTYSYSFYGCSRSAPFNGSYKALVILADADGTGAMIDEITLRTKEQDYDEALQQMNSALAEIKWKTGDKH